MDAIIFPTEIKFTDINGAKEIGAKNFVASLLRGSSKMGDVYINITLEGIVAWAAVVFLGVIAVSNIIIAFKRRRRR